MDNTQDIIERARREVMQRRAAKAQTSDDQPWLWAFAGLSLTLIVGLLLWPTGTLAERLQMVVHGVCAQIHYLQIGQYTLPLCARNTGIYSGFLATLLYLMALGRSRAAKFPPLAIVVVLAVAVVAMGVDGVNSMLRDLGGHNMYTPRNELRVATGLGMGIAIGVFGLLLFNISLRSNAQHDLSPIRRWIELAGLSITAVLLYGLVWWAPGWLYYPLAIFSVLGIVGLLFMANVFIIAMLSGFEGRLTQLRQLARPATFGVLLAAGELALLAGLRNWIEHSLQLM
jgi:uncharacterized membrane protein